MSLSCPYCPSVNPLGEAWGMSPEGFASAKENHDRNHTVKCPTCGALKQKENIDETLS